MVEFINIYGLEVLGVVLVAIFGCLGILVSRFLNTETKRKIAKVVVQFVEQAWYTLHGEKKLAKALEVAEMLLKKKGIRFDADEMIVLIEAAVAEFNEAFKKPLESEDSASATYRVSETAAASNE